MIKNHYLFSMYSFFFSMFSKSHLFWCIYCTKLEPISKIGNVTARAERVVALTKIVRSEKAPRTGEYASNPERKNTPCISVLAGVKFLLKKERVFFFRGSALDYSGSRRGEMRTRFYQNYFLGKGFGETSADFVFAFVRAEEGSGEESARASLSDFFGDGLSENL